MDAEERSPGQTLLSDLTRFGTGVRLTARTVAGLAIAFLFTRRLGIIIFHGEPIGVTRILVETIATSVFATLVLVLLSVVPLRRDLVRIERLITETESELRDRNEAQRFLRDTQSAFEMSEYEGELFEIAGIALREAGPGRAEILVADASSAHVERVATAAGRDAPGCGVTTPHSCPAVRQGHTLRFSDVNGLASCPRLRERQLPEGVVAACIPINILGTPAAVLHAVSDIDNSRDLNHGVRVLEGLAVRLGARLGMMRAIAQSLVQAESDPLTGLLNRRALENRVRKLRSEQMPFALAMADLDHFKDLNDTFGHDTGDRALRLFARVAQNAVRDGDLVSRHGGEEFVFVLVGSNATDGAPVLNRLQKRLAEALAGAQLPPFTVSAGLVDSTWSDDLPELLEHADRALLQAKAAGRDRIVIGDVDAPQHEHTYTKWHGSNAPHADERKSSSVAQARDAEADESLAAPVGGIPSV